MKKVIVFLTLTVALLLCLVSCFGQTEHTHNFGEWVTIKKATCGQDGEIARYCECGERQSEILYATGEHVEIVYEAVAPTCTETGLTEGKCCSVCNVVILAQTVINAKGHTEVIDAAVAPTCTATGLTEGKHCSVCNEVIVKQGIAPIVPHSYDDKYDESCNVCDNIRDAECAHKETDVIPGFASTCTEPGLTEGQKCKKCGEVLVHQIVINANGHTEVIDEAISATCTNSGLTEGKHCSYCETVLVKQKVIPALGHIYNTTYCFDDTFHWHACTGCDVIKNKVEHNLGDDGFCTVCDAVIGATEGLIYELSDDETYAILVAYEGAATKIKIAEEYMGVPVTTIYDKTFYLNSNIVSVILPDGLTHIGDQAFRGCYNLTEVVLGSNIISIGDYGFDGCNKLLNITFPDSLRSIGDWAFCNCHSLTSITIPNNVETIGRAAFRSCFNVTSLIIGEAVNSIDWSALGDCNLDSIVSKSARYYVDGNCLIDKNTNILIAGCNNSIIPEGVTAIGSWAFSGRKKLNSVVIPDSVIDIQDRAFAGCGNLRDLVIPNSVKSVDIEAFANCNSSLYTEYNYVRYVKSGDNPYAILMDTTIKTLKTYTIHEDTQIIAYGAFQDCSLLSSITIPNNVTSIGYNAFWGCSNLNSIFMPNSITTINDYAFYNCTNLSSISIPNSVTYLGSSAFAGCDKLSSVVIPDKVTSIGEDAFMGCDELANVVIGDSVASIGVYAFLNCNKLTTIVISDSVTNISTGAFWGCSSLIDVYYTGTEDEWAAITIGSLNLEFTSATIHYNYVVDK